MFPALILAGPVQFNDAGNFNKQGRRRAMLKVNSVVCVGAALATVIGLSNVSAQEKLTPPPYVLTGFETIATGVTWDEAVIKRVLPPGVVPAKEMTGGINIYKAAGGYGPGGAYTAAYLWVDLEGLDASDGTKGRWMLAGVYGPSQKPLTTFQEFYGIPIRNGSARHEATNGGVRAVGSYGGRDLVAVDVKIDSSKCGPGGGGVKWLSDMPRTNHLVMYSAAFWGEVCPAEVLSARVIAPEGDPFAQFQPTKVNWSILFKGSVAVSPAVTRP
jgi:hypothetical protein